ncbi:hypothetical protein [Hymenobacter rubidus]|uniref:hypothetical protein n=1 Tax=Hymenobacter rubidus TaxID=1441626 RepID=UPI00191C9743|nr:hypothetical protein [Hymenobacter rubidus]
MQQKAIGYRRQCRCQSKPGEATSRVGGAMLRGLRRGLTVQICPHRHEAEMKLFCNVFNFSVRICRAHRHFGDGNQAVDDEFSAGLCWEKWKPATKYHEAVEQFAGLKKELVGVPSGLGSR